MKSTDSIILDACDYLYRLYRYSHRRDIPEIEHERDLLRAYLSKSRALVTDPTDGHWNLEDPEQVFWEELKYWFLNDARDSQSLVSGTLGAIVTEPPMVWGLLVPGFAPSQDGKVRIEPEFQHFARSFLAKDECKCEVCQR